MHGTASGSNEKLFSPPRARASGPWFRPGDKDWCIPGRDTGAMAIQRSMVPKPIQAASGGGKAWSYEADGTKSPCGEWPMRLLKSSNKAVA
jgi:hypothetical protein